MRRVRHAGRAGSALAVSVLLGTPALAAAIGPAPPPPSTARLQGSFGLAGRVTVAANVAGEHVHQIVLRAWGFVPLCPAGPCATVELVRNRVAGTDKLTLFRRAPALYVGTGSFYAPLRCGTRVYRRGEAVPFTITVRVTTAQVAGSATTAGAVRATYTNLARTNLTPCVAAPSHDAAIYIGTVILPPPPA
jgi:hypothetical protein